MHGKKPPSQRQLRVGEEIRHALSDIFLQGTLYAPALIGVSVTVPEVRISPDLKNATAYVFPLGGDAPEDFLKTLNTIAPQISHQMAKKVKLRFLPRLSFKIDDSFERADKIESILESISE